MPNTKLIEAVADRAFNELLTIILGAPTEKDALEGVECLNQDFKEKIKEFYASRKVN